MESHASSTSSQNVDGYESNIMNRDGTQPDNDVDPGSSSNEIGETDTSINNDVSGTPSDGVLLDVPDPTPGDSSKRSTLQRGLRRMTKRFHESPLIRKKASVEALLTDRCLRLVQIGLQLTTFGAGLLTSLPLWWTVRIFNNNCPLYLDMTLLKASNDTLILVTSDLAETNLKQCLYCTFAAVIACIYAIIWLWFYILMNDWGRRPTVIGEPPADLVMMIPTTGMNIVMFICAFVVVCLVTDGVVVWCSDIKKHLANGEDCDFVSTRHWNNVPDGELTYGYLQGAVAGAWLLLMALGGQTAVVSVRMYYYYRDRALEEEEWVTDDEAETSEDEDRPEREILSGSVIFDKFSESVILCSEDSGPAGEPPKPSYYDLNEIRIHPETSESSNGGTWVAEVPSDRGDYIPADKMDERVLVHQDNG